MDTLTVPPPDTIRQRILDCEAELKALRRLLRMSLATQQAAEARQRRTSPGKEVAHA